MEFVYILWRIQKDDFDIDATRHLIGVYLTQADAEAARTSEFFWSDIEKVETNKILSQVYLLSINGRLSLAPRRFFCFRPVYYCIKTIHQSVSKRYTLIVETWYLICYYIVHNGKMNLIQYKCHIQASIYALCIVYNTQARLQAQAGRTIFLHSSLKFIA